MGATPANEKHVNNLSTLSGLLCGLTVLPLSPPRPVSASIIVGLTVVLASTLLFDPKGREVLLVKFALWIKGGTMMVIGRDKKWKKKGRPDPALVVQAKDRRSKRLVLIRHGESTWNLIFNVGPKILLPFKALLALLKELVLVLRLDPNSIFYDSPLNDSGLAQAKELAELFENFDPTKPGADDVQKLLSPTASVMTTSNLRRAAQTVALAMRPRMEAHPSQKIIVLSSLQEISTNIDTLSLTPPLKAPVLSDVPLHLAGEDKFDATFNTGNKLLRGNGLQRMQAFAEWVFQRQEDTIIVGGHSLFFRSFFREFLPKDQNPFEARDVKIKNGGVVAITLDRGTVEAHDNGVLAGIQYRVDPDSITEVHLGFELSKQAKKKLQAQKKTN